MYWWGRRVPSPDIPTPRRDLVSKNQRYPSQKVPPWTSVKTRMHSSRMRTARLLTVSCIPGEGGSAQPTLDADLLWMQTPPRCRSPRCRPSSGCRPPGCRPPLDADPSLDADPPPPGCRLPLDADPYTMDADPPRCRHPGCKHLTPPPHPNADPSGHMTCDAVMHAGKPTPPSQGQKE